MVCSHKFPGLVHTPGPHLTWQVSFPLVQKDFGHKIKPFIGGFYLYYLFNTLISLIVEDFILLITACSNISVYFLFLFTYLIETGTLRACMLFAPWMPAAVLTRPQAPTSRSWEHNPALTDQMDPLM